MVKILTLHFFSLNGHMNNNPLQAKRKNQTIMVWKTTERPSFLSIYHYNMAVCCICLEEGRGRVECDTCRGGTVCKTCKNTLVTMKMLKCPVCREPRFTEKKETKARRKIQVVPLHQPVASTTRSERIVGFLCDVTVNFLKGLGVILVFEGCIMLFSWISMIVFLGARDSPFWVYLIVGHVVCLVFYCMYICCHILRWGLGIEFYVIQKKHILFTFFCERIGIPQYWTNHDHTHAETHKSNSAQEEKNTHKTNKHVLDRAILCAARGRTDGG